MENRVLRWGLLSTARINRALIPPLRASSRNQLVAVASRSAEQAEGYARDWDIPRAHSSYESLLADPEIDVIYNPLPNSMHTEWSIRAAQAGKHVLCEKPLALSVDEVDAMIQASQQYGVVIAEAFMYRHHPQTLKAKDLVDSGALGDLALIRGSFSFSLTRPGNVRWDPALGGGSLWDVGCYPVSYARFIAGAEPEEVFGWQVSTPEGVDATFAGQLRFPANRQGAVLAQIDSSFRLPERTQIEIAGTEASLRIPIPFKPGLNETIYLVRDGEVQSLSVPGQDLYSGEVEDMAAAILDGQPPRVSLNDSRANVAALVALLESARLGAPVALSA